MTREEIEKAIAEHEATIENSRMAITALSEQRDKMPKRETVRHERWLNHYRSACCAHDSLKKADFGKCDNRLGPAERLVREFDLVDGKCVEQRDGITGRVIWREGGAARVEMPEKLLTPMGHTAMVAYEAENGVRKIVAHDRAWCLSPDTLTAWLRRAVAWVNDGEVGR